MAEPITREEFNATVGRIHDKVDRIAETTTKIETASKMVQIAVDKMCDCIYGNGKVGVTQKITQLFERVSLHTKLLIFVFCSIVAMAYKIIENFFNGK